MPVMSWRFSRFPARRAVLLAGLLAGLTATRARGQPRSVIGGPFALVDQNGRPVTDRDLRGRYLLVYFGYTCCPDLCPTSLAKMARVLTLLEGTGAKLRAVFITVDPARDTPAAIGAYTRQFSPDILGLTGSPSAITQVTAEYHVFVGGRDLKNGVIKHGSLMYLMGPDGRFIREFSGNETAETVADKIGGLPRTG